MKPSLSEIIEMLDEPTSLPESDVLEYKSQIHSNAFTKYIETICSFMNTGGGYIIYGVTDNLMNVGLNQGKLYDKIILQFDGIIHQHLIYGMDEHGMNIPILKHNLKVHSIHNKHHKHFIIVDITTFEPVVYRLRDGSIYYRLNASNYVNKTEILFTEQTVNEKMNLIKRDYQMIIDKNLKTYKIEMDKKEKELDELRNKIIKQEVMILKKQSFLQVIFPCFYKL